MRQSARDVGLILSFFLFLLLLFLFLLLLPVIMYLPVSFPIVLHPLPQKGHWNSNLPKKKKKKKQFYDTNYMSGKWSSGLQVVPFKSYQYCYYYCHCYIITWYGVLAFKDWIILLWFWCHVGFVCVCLLFHQALFFFLYGSLFLFLNPILGTGKNFQIC